jgi:AcrR family transcriptional regulator
VAAVAKAAGVTPNTLYWYFPSKDHLFAAVLERWIAYALGVVDTQVEAGPPVQVVRVVANVYRELQPLLATIHERAAFVEVLAGLHDILHLGLREPLVKALEQVYEQPSDAEAAADLLLVVFEGAHAHAYADPKEGLVETAIGLLATTP